MIIDKNLIKGTNLESRLDNMILECYDTEKLVLKVKLLIQKENCWWLSLLENFSSQLFPVIKYFAVYVAFLYEKPVFI